MGAQTEVIHSGMPAQAARLLGQTAQATAQTATGSTQADALPLTSNLTNFGTVGASTGALLPTATGQSTFGVVNGGGAPLTVYPALGESINFGTVNVGFSVTNAKTAIFVPHLNTWVAVLSA